MIPSEGAPIILSSWNNVMTKGEGDALGRTVGGTAFAANDVFYVYGTKDTDSSNPVFDGVQVSASGNPITWTYSPLRFWDRNAASYTFYAVSPSEEHSLTNVINTSATDFTAANGLFESKDFEFSGSNTDVLVAAKNTVAKSNFGQKVHLDFYHTAALFDLKVRLGDGLANDAKTANKTGVTVNITKIALKDIKSKGHFTVGGYVDATPAKPILNGTTADDVWTADATPTRASYSEMSAVNAPSTAISSSNKFEVDVAQSTSGGPKTLIDNLVVMPQAFTAGSQDIGDENTAHSSQQLEIEYEIITGTDTADTSDDQTVSYHKFYDLILFDIVDYPTDTNGDGDFNNDTDNVSGWLPGVHYTYILTINADAITFGAEIRAWGTDNGYYYILN